MQAAPLFSFACWLANKCCGGKLRTWFVIVLIAGNDAARIHQMMEGMAKEGQLAGSSGQDRSPVRKSSQSSAHPGAGENAMDCVHLTGSKISGDSCECDSFFKSMLALCKRRGPDIDRKRRTGPKSPTLMPSGRLTLPARKQFWTLGARVCLLHFYLNVSHVSFRGNM